MQEIKLYHLDIAIKLVVFARSSLISSSFLKQ